MGRQARAGWLALQVILAELPERCRLRAHARFRKLLLPQAVGGRGNQLRGRDLSGGPRGRRCARLIRS